MTDMVFDSMEEAADEARPMWVNIEIDTLDADECPSAPFTLNVYIGNEPQRDAIVGASIPEMLRELADAWEDN